MSRITLYQHSDVGGREDLELSEDNSRLEIIEMGDYGGNGWQETGRTRIVVEVLTKGVELYGIQEGIEKRAKKKWDRALFRLVKKLEDREISLSIFKKSVKYKPERHKYPQGQPRL